jgi:hypothetical protein
LLAPYFFAMSAKQTVFASEFKLFAELFPCGWNRQSQPHF